MSRLEVDVSPFWYKTRTPNPTSHSGVGGPLWSLAASAVYSYLPDNAVGDYSTLESRYYTCVILVVYTVLTYIMSIPEAEVMRQWLAEDAPGATVASWAGILDEAYALYIEALGLTIEEPFQTFAFLEDEGHDEAVNGIILNDQPIRAGPKARFRRFRAATREAAGLGRQGGETTAAPVIVQPAAEPKPGVKVSLSLIVQGSDVKIDILSREILDEYHKNYKARMGRAPGV